MKKNKLIQVIKTHRYFIIVSLIYFISRLVKLNTDFNVLEPDEIDYWHVSRGFVHGWWPTLRGALYVENFPLFPYFAFLLSKLIPSEAYLVPLRLLSVFGSYLVGSSMYLFFKNKKYSQLSLVAPTIFWLIPLSLYYSRTGTQEMLFLGLAYLGIILFINSSKKNKFKSVLSALFLALAVLTKTNALVFLLTPALITFLKPKKYLKPLIRFGISLLLFLSLALIPFYLRFGQEFISQSKSLPTKHLLPLINLRVHLATQYIYLQKLPYLLSLAFLTILILGIFQLMKSRNKTKHIITELICLIIPGLLFIYLFDYSPRYLLILLPSLIIVSSFSFLKFKKITIILLILILPFSFRAYQATLHTWSRQLKPIIQTYSNDHRLSSVYSTFEWNKLSYYFDQNVRLLTPSATNSANLIIIDQRKSELMLSLTESEFQEAKATYDYLQTQEPIYTINDPYNHFPGDRRPNTFNLYFLK
jgi:hypothetical protein